MKTEDKELLLQDLCARLLYGVIGEYSWKGNEPYNRELTGCLFDELKSSWDSTEDSEFLPYLRPMSSMTEEEKKEELIGLFATGAIFIGGLIDECFEFADANPHWISVKDELPLPNESVIVYRKHGQMCDARFSKYGYWVDYSGYMMTQNVTHWMPMPALPKKGGKEC